MSQYTHVLGIKEVSRALFDYESDERADHVEDDKKWADLKFVYGWDQPLQSFYLQVHDAFVADLDANPVIWLGATQDTTMYETEDLAREAQKYGLVLGHDMRVKLYGDKDDGI